MFLRTSMITCAQKSAHLWTEVIRLVGRSWSNYGQKPRKFSEGGVRMKASKFNLRHKKATCANSIHFVYKGCFRHIIVI